MSEENKVKLTATEYRRLSKAEPDLMKQLSVQKLLSIVKDAAYTAVVKEKTRIWQAKLDKLNAEIEAEADE
jgi:hypothetical protein